jgi:hypothetical protein
MMVDVVRWPGFLLNAQSFVVGRCTMDKDMIESLYSSSGVERGV